MTYLLHSRLTISGTWLHDTDEVWDCTISVSVGPPVPAGGSFVPNKATFLSDIASGVSDWFSSSFARIPNYCNLVSLKVADIGADGAYVGAPAVHDYVPTIAGGLSVASNFPGFNSLAYTWTSARTRPPGKFGRIYPPNVAMTLDNTHSAFKLTDGEVADSVQAGYNLLTAIAHGGSYCPVIASKVGSGRLDAITSVSCDNIVDVQRRRKNRITGVRSTHVFP